MLTYDKPINLKIQKDTGYQYFNDPTHPLAGGNSGKVYYHRHVASLIKGRWLYPTEVVHHIDGNRINNSPKNLLVVTNAKHGLLHNPHVLRIRKCKQCQKKYPATHKRQKYCSSICSHLAQRRTTRPSILQLRKEVAESNFCAVGRKYGVTDNAIRKWMGLK